MKISEVKNSSANKYKTILNDLVEDYKLNPEYYTVGEPSDGWLSFESTMEDFEGYVELPVSFDEVDNSVLSDLKTAKWMIEGPFTGQIHPDL